MSSIIVSPEYAGDTGRAEALADVAIEPGNFISYSATGFALTAADAQRQLVALENKSIAGDVTTAYAIGENVFAAFLPVGAKVHATMSSATYAVGDVLEVGTNGRLGALTTGVAAAVVPPGSGGTVSNDDLMIVQLL